MIDFADLPKQWLLGRGPALAGLGEVVNGKRATFDDLVIVAAASVPLVTLRRGGTLVGLLIGWPIHESRLHQHDTVVTLDAEQSVDEFFASLGGRFVMLWRGTDGGHFLREDSVGSLPAVFSKAAGLAGATTTALSAAAPQETDQEVADIFAFPQRRGFLPFGLTNARGVERLLPNHALDLSSFRSQRVWPSLAFCAADRVEEGEHHRKIDEVCQIAVGHMRAVCAQEPAVLYLSGGHDSRMALAAMRGHTQSLRLETFVDGSADSAIARRVARAATLPHRRIEIQPISDAERARWIWRAGFSIYDHVTELSATLAATDPGTQPVVGTSAELLRASNWAGDDHQATELDLDTLLSRLRLPDHPRLRKAGAAWMASLPACDAAMMLDIAKIEQIHACWAGAEVYGNPLPRPSVHAFASQRYNEIALRLSKPYRLGTGAYRDVVGRLWPELLQIQVNQPIGLERARFWRSEVKRLMPVRLKRFLKPLR